MFQPAADIRGLLEHVTELRSVGAELRQQGFTVAFGKDMSVGSDTGSGFPIGDPQDALADGEDEAAYGCLLTDRIPP